MSEHAIAALVAGGRLVTTRGAAAVGVDRSTLSRAVVGGALLRVRAGLYAEPGSWASLPPWTRYDAVVRAVLESHPTWAASHHAALTVHGLPLHGVDLGRVDVAARVRTSKVRGGVPVHRLLAEHRGVLGGHPPALPVAPACVLAAATSGLEAGVVSMDAALHRSLCSRQDLEKALAHPGARYGAGAARAAVAAADGRSESPGESRTRLLLSALGVDVTPQVEISDQAGFVGRVDLLVGGRVVVEFDGLTKYAHADGPEALAREKRREERLRDAGYRVVRLTWADLARPDLVLDRVRAALAAAVAA